MRRPCVVVLVALAGSCGTTSSNAPRTRVTAKDIVQQSSPAIVRIEAGKEKVGTGFIVDKSGVIATNLHVVRGESAIRVRLLDGTQYQVAQIAGYDKERDLALLRILPGKDLPVLKLGDSDAMSAGDQIVAIGNPLGVFDYSVTSGLISQVRQVCGPQESAEQHCPKELTVLQISAAISPGSSGGPLFNQFGEVVGVTTAIVTAGQNINLAVPGNYLKPLVALKAAMSTDDFAKTTRPADAQPAEADDYVPERHVPVHEVAVFHGCSPDDIIEVVQQIGKTIDLGAPLYNAHQSEACFRIYEGTALKLSHDAGCAGVRSAFGEGLTRASGLQSYKEKAWALRDAFDGLLAVAERWAEQNPQAVPHSGGAAPAAPPATQSQPTQPQPPPTLPPPAKPKP